MPKERTASRAARWEAGDWHGREIRGAKQPTRARATLVRPSGAPGDRRLYPALPENISLLPRWLATSVIVTLVGLTVCLTFVHTRQNHRVERMLWFVVAGVITAFTALSLGLMVTALPQKPESASDLLWSAGALWSTNVLVFALWYWHLDAGVHTGARRVSATPTGPSCSHR